MRTIAIGGLLYPIDRFLHPSVKHYSVGVVGQRSMFESVKREVRRSSEPVRIVGFSRGATFALELYEAFNNVAEVYAHSVGKIPDSHTRSNHPRVSGKASLFRTEGDRAGGVYYETKRAFDSYLREGHRNLRLTTLPFTPIERPRNPVERGMNRFQHCFHNCLAYLPVELIR